MERKDFFKQTGRLLLLGGITGLSGYLVLNKKVSAICSQSTLCIDCRKFSYCDMPQAKEIKDGK